MRLRDFINEVTNAFPNNAIGIHIYPGTNITSLDDLMLIYSELASTLKGLRVSFDFIDIGGGFGINYRDVTSVNITSLFDQLSPVVSNLSFHRFLLEPGRFIVGPAGMLVTKVIDIKSEDKVNYVVIDAGLSHYPRIYIYEQEQMLEPISAIDLKEQIDTFIVGSSMASGDFFWGHPQKKPNPFPQVKVDDLIAICFAGAYGRVMSSNFSGLLRPAEVLVQNGEKVHLIREPEKPESVVAEFSKCLITI